MRVFTEVNLKVRLSETEDVEMSKEELELRIAEVKETIAHEFEEAMVKEGLVEKCEAELLDFTTKILD